MQEALVDRVELVVREPREGEDDPVLQDSMDLMELRELVEFLSWTVRSINPVTSYLIHVTTDEYTNTEHLTPYAFTHLEMESPLTSHHPPPPGKETPSHLTPQQGICWRSPMPVNQDTVVCPEMPEGGADLVDLGPLVPMEIRELGVYLVGLEIRELPEKMVNL